MKWPIDRVYGIGLDDIAPFQGPNSVELPARSDPGYMKAWQKNNPGRSALHEAKWRRVHPKGWLELNEPYSRKYLAKKKLIGR